jgi:hypothetical protein
MTGHTDPPVWGAQDLPLLPAGLRAFCTEENIELPLSALPTKASRRNRSLSVACGPRWSIQPPFGTSAIDVVMEIIDDIVETENFRQALDTQLLNCQIRWAPDLAHLPLMNSTWDSIDAAGFSHADLAYLLATGTGLEALEYLGSITAVFDLLITTPAWLDEGNRVIVPTTPTTLDEAFVLARFRHVRQGGAQSQYVNDPVWVECLGRRAGLVSQERIPTLEECGSVAGVTKERVRQIQRSCGINHSVRRRWPIAGELADYAASISGLKGSTSRSAQEVVDKVHPHSATAPLERLIQLLEEYGQKLALRVTAGALQTDENNAASLILSEADIFRIARELAGAGGFLRQSELETSLNERYPQIELEILRELLDNSPVETNLPLGYAFAAGRDGAVYGVAERMLAWTSPLSTHVLRGGMDRRFRMRKLPAPPPETVIASLLERHPKFTRSGDVIGLVTPAEPKRPTIQTWLADAIRESPSGVLHRLAIVDRACTAGHNLSSILVYLSFAEVIVPVGNGCFAVVGDEVNPRARAEAVADLELIRLPTIVRYQTDGSSVELSIMVGHTFVGSGVLSSRQSVVRRFGGRSLPLFQNGVQRGHIGVSGANVYGFTQALASMHAAPGDSLVLTIDFDSRTAELRRDLLVDSV